MTGRHDEQDHRIADYIRGTLDEASAARLEVEMLEDDVLFARVQAEELLQRGLRTTDLRPDEVSRPGWMFWTRPGSALVGALSLSVVVLAVWNVNLTGRLANQQVPQAAIPVITLYDERSLLTEPLSTGIDSLQGAALIEIDVSAHGDQAFELELKIGDNTHRWESMRPDERGYLTAFIPDTSSLESIRVFDQENVQVQEYEMK